MAGEPTTKRPSTKRPTMRDIKEQLRQERHRDFLEVALRMVTTEGIATLTMPRLADELGCGIGTLYRHFPSKDALIAELQIEALGIIGTSFVASQAALEQLLAERGIHDDAVTSLARVAGAVRYWVSAELHLPREIELLRTMFTDPAVHMDEEEGQKVLPASLLLLELARSVLDAAVEAGALRDGPAVQRAIVVLSGTTGVLMTSALQRWDADLFHGQEMARLMARDLFLGWGADPDRLALVEGLLDELEAAGTLVPVA